MSHPTVMSLLCVCLSHPTVMFHIQLLCVCHISTVCNMLAITLSYDCHLCHTTVISSYDCHLVIRLSSLSYDCHFCHTTVICLQSFLSLLCVCLSHPTVMFHIQLLCVCHISTVCNMLAITLSYDCHLCHTTVISSYDCHLVIRLSSLSYDCHFCHTTVICLQSFLTPFEPVLCHIHS